MTNTVGALADGAVVASSELVRIAVSRRSARTGDRHEIGGVVGSVVYEGESLGGALPWLRLAEALGVGKHATFGNGRIAVDVLD